MARLAGTGTTSVSRYFTGRGYLGEDTRKKIEAVVKKTNFRINRAASLLKSQESRQIAMIIPFGGTRDIYPRQFFMNQKFSAAMMESFRREYELLLLPADLDSPAGAERFEKTLRTHNFSGALLLEAIPASILALIRRMNIPYALSNFNDCYADPAEKFDYKEGEPNGVLTDYPGVIGEIFSFAKARGYTAIALAGFERNIFGYPELVRKQFSTFGFLDLSRPLSDFLAGKEKRIEGAENAGRVLFAARSGADVMAVHRSFHDRLSGDWGLLAFDPHPEFEFLDPKPSYFEQDVDRIGAESVALLIDLIEGKTGKNAVVPSRLIPAKIVERGTTGSN